MLAGADDATVQERCCATLWNLASKRRSYAAAIADAGGIDAVLAAMVRFPSAAAVQESGCGALLFLSAFAGDASCCRRISEIVQATTQRHANLRDIGEEVMQALRASSSADVAPADAAGSTADLSAMATNVQHAVVAGHHNSVITAMRNHADDVDVQEQGCTVLHSLTRSRRNAGPIAICGAIGAVSSAMRRHDSAVVQEQGCAALRYMTEPKLGYDGDNSIAVAVTVILTALQRNVDVAAIQVHGGTVLLNLCSAPEARHLAAVVAAGGVKAVMTAMRRHEGVVEVQTLGCDIMRVIGLASVDRVAAVGGFEAVVSAMQLHTASSEVQEHGCLALSELCTAAPGAIAAAGGIEAVVSALRTHASHAAVRRHGDTMIQRLVGRTRAVSATYVVLTVDVSRCGDVVTLVTSLIAVARSRSEACATVGSQRSINSVAATLILLSMLLLTSVSAWRSATRTG
jgi:hypothetical protein